MDKNKPHYIYISAILLDGKIWKWNVSLNPMTDLINEEMIIPQELKYLYKTGDEYRETMSEFFRRFSIFNYPIWVENLTEHNNTFAKAKNIYKKFPIHEDYCMGVKPYEE